MLRVGVHNLAGYLTSPRVSDGYGWVNKFPVVRIVNICREWNGIVFVSLQTGKQ